MEVPYTYVILAQPLEPPSEQALAQGYHLRVVDRLRNHPRALDPAMKSGNYLNSILGYLEGTEDHDKGASPLPVVDALLCNADGHVTEGTTFNIFYVKRGIVVTSPLDIGILDGLTRRHLLRLCRENGIPARETRFPVERLLEADEVFWASTIKEAFPVTWINGKKIGNGKPGKVTLRLRKLFQDWAESTL